MGLIPKALQLVVALVGVFWLAIVGGWAVRSYDELRVTPAWHVRVLFVHFSLGPPASLAPAYVQGMADPRSPAALALGRCQANEATLQEALDRQSAAVRALGAAGANARASAEAAVQRARSAAAGANEAERRILAVKPQGRGYCPDYEAVDKAFVGTLP